MVPIKGFTKTHLPPSMARLVKRVGVYPRYWWQARACGKGYQKYGDRYEQKILFVAGLPKSGTTWLEKMIASYPGFHELLIPDVAEYELATGGSHDYELPVDMFSRFKNRLVLTKMHVHGSLHNVSVLQKAGIRYVILFRDLRDVAVSYYYYVHQTPWHPEYSDYVGKELKDGLLLFGKRTLPYYAAWVTSWDRNRDVETSLMIRYEDMLADPVSVMIKVANLFDLDAATETIQAIVDDHRFEKLSGGRRQGVAAGNNFFRKGIAGDWRNHFDEELRDLYMRQISDYLIEFGYEKDRSW